MSNPGIRILQRGGNVNNASPEEFSYTSDFQSPKVNKPFRGEFTTNASGYGSAIVAHDLGYQPGALGYYKAPGLNWKKTDNISVGLVSGTRDVSIITFDYGIDPPDPNFVNKTIQYKIWVLQDPARGIVR